MIKGHANDPWADIFYMCGSCGHAIHIKKLEDHALFDHGAMKMDIYEEAGGALRSQELNNNAS